MKKNRALYILIFTIIPYIVFSQTPTSVEKSNITDTIGNKIYFKHPIKKGHTIYSISKAYNVSIDKIEDLNPEIEDGLKIEDTLFIPKEILKPSQSRQAYSIEKQHTNIPEKDSISDSTQTFTPSSKKSTNIQHSKEQAYYIHTVSKGQTLYFLSKLYDTTTTALYASNPGISENISIGQKIKIPCKSCPPPQKNTKIEIEKKPKKPIKYTIDSLESIYDIAYKYNIPPEIIYTYNPELTDTTDTVLYEKKIELPIHKKFKQQHFIYYEIPRNTNVSRISQKFRITNEELKKYNPRQSTKLEHKAYLKIPINDNNKKIAQSVHEEQKEYIFHTVKPKETIYSITKKYDINERTLYSLNGNLSRWKPLSVDDVLKIPAPENTETYIYCDTITRKRSQEKLLTPLLAECFDTTKTPRTSYNIALLLPFFLEANNDLDDDTDIIDKQRDIFKPSIPFIEYYEGVLLGIDSLRKRGISINLHTFDVNKDSLEALTTLRKLENKNLDLIIGPVFPSIFNIIYRFADKNQIPIVSPLAASDYILEKHPLAIQINPPERLRHNKVAKKILTQKTEKEKKHIILVYNSVVLEEQQVNHCHKTIQKVYNEDTISNDSIVITDILFPEDKIEGLKNAMDEDAENIIVVVSRNQAFITNLVTQLYWHIKDYPINLYAFSSWEQYENIELNFLFELQLRYSTSGYIDYSSDSVCTFVETYRSFFKTEPSRFSFQGYDHILYFVESLEYFDTNLIHCLPAYTKKGLYTEFSFIKEHEENGLINNSIEIIKFSKEDNKLHVLENN
ncbi:MAG: LysM peptidoglycan-binding domain-containing protein [Bacteroidales bacterium]